MKELFPDQVLGVDMLRGAIKAGHKRILVQAPVAWGKTIFAAEIFRRCMRSIDKPLWFCADAISLIDQTAAKLVAQGVPERSIGIFQADHPGYDPDAQVQVVSTMTLARRMLRNKPYMVFVDESHVHYEIIADLMTDPLWEHVIFVGLSASPWSKGLGRYYTHLIKPVSMAEMIEMGRLSSYRALEPSVPEGLSSMPTQAGDYQKKALGKMMMEPQLVADIVETWKAKGEGLPTLCFCVDRAHAKSVQKRFLEAGVGCDYVDAYTDRKEREAIEGRLNAGLVKVVCNVGCLTKGVDWAVGCVILARPTKSEMLMVQMIGRALRDNRSVGIPYPAIILDHGGCMSRMGYPESIDKPELCTKEKGERSDPPERDRPLPKPCPVCKTLNPPGIKCSCGFIPEKVSKVEEQKGELVEKRKPAVDIRERDRFYAEMRGYAALKGKQDGYAWHATRQRFGSAPRDKLPPVTPTPATITWIKSQNIRRTKGQAKHVRA